MVDQIDDSKGIARLLSSDRSIEFERKREDCEGEFELEVDSDEEQDGKKREDSKTVIEAFLR